MRLKDTLTKIGGMLAIAACCLTSCDYLDVVPPEQAGLKDATKTPESTKGFLYSCYAGIKEFFPWQYTGVEASTDEYALPPLWSHDGQKVAWGLATPGNASAWKWGTFYRYIGQCHLFLSQLENAQGISDVLKKEWSAEANFLIAYYHYRLLEYYGPIPITDSYIDMDTPSNEYNGRSHFDYVVNWICMKLDKAAEDLPASRVGDEWGRATSTIAKAIKARILLYAASPLWNGQFPFPEWKNEKYTTPGYGYELVSKTYDPDKWERALTACKDALEWAEGDGGNALMGIASCDNLISNDQMGDPFKKLKAPVDNDAFTEDFKKRIMLMRYIVTTRYSDGNKEMIWGVAGTDTYNQKLACLPLHCSKQNNGTYWNDGYSGISPYLNAVEKFYTKDGMLPRIAAEQGTYAAEDTWYEPYKGDIIRLNSNREPRFYAWIAFDGDQYAVKLNNGEPLEINLKDPAKQGKSVTGNSARNYCVTGYLCKKFIRPNTNWTQYGNLDQKDYPATLVRLAELYLNLAECYASKDNPDETSALKYLNTIRRRAGIPELTHEIIEASGMSLVEWVHNERFVELYGEGHRYYDARRWMTAPQAFAAGVRKGLNIEKLENPSFEELNQPVTVQQDFKWENRMYLAPVFVNEVYKNTQMVQAPEY